MGLFSDHSFFFSFYLLGASSVNCLDETSLFGETANNSQTSKMRDTRFLGVTNQKSRTCAGNCEILICICRIDTVNHLKRKVVNTSVWSIVFKLKLCFSLAFAVCKFV